MSTHKKTSRNTSTAATVELVPFEQFKKSAAVILSNTKKQSDAQIADFQASNRRRRESKKKG